MEWKDRAADDYLVPLSQLLARSVDEDFARILFMCQFDTGFYGAGGIYYDEDNNKKGLAIINAAGAAEIQQLCMDYRDRFMARNERWVAMKLTISNDGGFDVIFEYEDPYRWEELEQV